MTAQEQTKDTLDYFFGTTSETQTTEDLTECSNKFYAMLKDAEPFVTQINNILAAIWVGPDNASKAMYIGLVFSIGMMYQRLLMEEQDADATI